MHVFALKHFRPLRTIYALALTGTALLVCPLSRADAVYTSAASFGAASAGLSTVHFDGLATSPDFQYALNGNPLSVGNVQFTVYGPGSVVTGQNQYVQITGYTDGAFLFADNGTPDHIRVTFPGSTAVGFNVGGVFSDPGSITVTLSDGHSEVLTGLSGDHASAGSIGFLGFTSTTLIHSVDIVFQPPTVGGSSFGAFDNFAYGSALGSVMPEPTGLILMGTGMIALAGVILRSRKKA